MDGAELLLVALGPFVAYIAGAPARIEELPLAVIDPDRVPGMTGRVGGRDSVARHDRVEAEALAVTANQDAFQATALRDGLVYLGVALAHGLPREDYLVHRLAAGNAAPEKAVRIVGDVVVAPREDGTGLVGGGREGSADVVGYVAHRIIPRETGDGVLCGDGSRAPRSLGTLGSMPPAGRVAARAMPRQSALASGGRLGEQAAAHRRSPCASGSHSALPSSAAHSWSEGEEDVGRAAPAPALQPRRSKTGSVLRAAVPAETPWSRVDSAGDSWWRPDLGKGLIRRSFLGLRFELPSRRR